MYLIFDTETTGVPHNKTAPITDLDNWPRLVQIAWQLHDRNGKLISLQNFIVKPEGFDIPYKAEQVHGVSTKRALEEGNDLSEVLHAFIAFRRHRFLSDII
jgi:DNA polymerase-3 subunit alpha